MSLNQSYLNSLPDSGNLCHLRITFQNSLGPIRPKETLRLIWVQIVWLSDGIPEDIFNQEFRESDVLPGKTGVKQGKFVKYIFPGKVLF